MGTFPSLADTLIIRATFLRCMAEYRVAEAPAQKGVEKVQELSALFPRRAASGNEALPPAHKGGLPIPEGMRGFPVRYPEGPIVQTPQGSKVHAGFSFFRIRQKFTPGVKIHKPASAAGSTWGSHLSASSSSRMLRGSRSSGRRSFGIVLTGFWSANSASLWVRMVAVQSLLR